MWHWREVLAKFTQIFHSAARAETNCFPHWTKTQPKFLFSSCGWRLQNGTISTPPTTSTPLLKGKGQSHQEKRNSAQFTANIEAGAAGGIWNISREQGWQKGGIQRHSPSTSGSNLVHSNDYWAPWPNSHLKAMHARISGSVLSVVENWGDKV